MLVNQKVGVMMKEKKTILYHKLLTDLHYKYFLKKLLQRLLFYELLVKRLGKNNLFNHLKEKGILKKANKIGKGKFMFTKKKKRKKNARKRKQKRKKL
jgi:hypothetical protein